jgi:8-oxo-dGTP pyrophosphatase MutT (NUDIX family)
MPRPNAVESVLAAHPEDDRLVTSTVVFVWNPRRELLLTQVASRGWDVPGGHVEPGEGPRETASRELYEETGVAIPVAELRPAGFVRLRLDAPRPARYGYPYPVSCMVAWTCQVRQAQPSPVPGSECVEAAWFSLEAAHQHVGSGPWWPLAAAGAPGMQSAAQARTE